MWPETPTPVCVTGDFCTAQNSLGTPVIKTQFSQIPSVKSIFFPLFSRMHNERAQPSREPREAAQSEEASVCPKGILPPAVSLPQPRQCCPPYPRLCGVFSKPVVVQLVPPALGDGPKLSVRSGKHPVSVPAPPPLCRVPSLPAGPRCSAAASSLSTNMLRLRFPPRLLTLPCEVLLRKKCCVLGVLQQNCA